MRRQPTKSKAKALCLRLASSPLLSYRIYNTFTAQFQNLLRFVRIQRRLWPVPKRISAKMSPHCAADCVCLPWPGLSRILSLALGWPLQPLEQPPSGSILAPSWHLACQPILHILLFIINFHSAAFFLVFFLPPRPVRQATSAAAAAASSPRRFQFSGCPLLLLLLPPANCRSSAGPSRT